MDRRISKLLIIILLFLFLSPFIIFIIVAFIDMYLKSVPILCEAIVSSLCSIRETVIC